MNPAISVIIPTCDRPELLQRAVGTVLRQTQKPREIIIVNNGQGKVKLPQEILSQVRVVDAVPYAGPAQARNFGASLATGTHLAFLDDDNQWNERYLENVSRELAKGTECVLNAVHIVKDGKRVPWKIQTGLLRPEVLLVQNPGAGGPNIVLSKELFFRVRGYDPKLPPSEDKALVLEVLRLGKEVVVLPENWVIDGTQASGRLTTNQATFAEGIFQFTRKYRRLMNREQYFFNRWKAAKYGGQHFAKMFWAIGYRLARFWNKLKRLGPARIVPPP